jgi:hypothetical protein
MQILFCFEGNNIAESMHLASWLDDWLGMLPQSGQAIKDSLPSTWKLKSEQASASSPRFVRKYRLFRGFPVCETAADRSSNACMAIVHIMAMIVFVILSVVDADRWQPPVSWNAMFGSTPDSAIF